MNKKLIDEDSVPSNLEECLDCIKSNLTEEDKIEIKSKGCSSTMAHFGAGMYLRNEWSLWESESRLVKWFKAHYGVEHADDISGIIMECLWNDVRGEPRRDKILAEQYLKHWQQQSDDQKKFSHYRITKDGDIFEVDKPE